MYELPFSEYVENANAYNKFAMVITKSQYAIEVNHLTHEEMIADLMKKTRKTKDLSFYFLQMVSVIHIAYLIT